MSSNNYDGIVCHICKQSFKTNDIAIWLDDAVQGQIIVHRSCEELK